MSVSLMQAYTVMNSATVKKTLLNLYKLVVTIRKGLGSEAYQYNYNYIPPLAMTEGPPLLDSGLHLPLEELPNPKWIFLVLHKLAVITVNKAIGKLVTEGSELVSFSVTEGPEADIDLLNEKAQALEELEQQIQSADSEQDLEQVALQLAALTREISDELDPVDSSSVSFDISSAPESELEAQIREIDEQVASSEEVSFSVPSGTEESEGISDSLLAAFREAITSSGKLIELDEQQATSGEVSFSVDSFAAAPSLEDYNKLFTRISLPKISARFQEDQVFAYMQVAGPNAVMLEQVAEGDPFVVRLTQELPEGGYAKIIGTGDSLAAAVKEGRVYKADYSLLEGMENGTFPDQQKYTYAPLGLFAVPPQGCSSRNLLPVAIQCQPGADCTGPVFTPLKGESWMVAKTILQMANVNYLELVSHLGQTHLVIEPFVLATKRILPRTHRLRLLLDPHFEGTVLINYGAHKTLIAPGWDVDKLLASTIENDGLIAVKGAQSHLHNFNEVSFPKLLASRGVTNSAQLPEYPYRDDGLLIWNALHEWVSDYLRLCYTSDAQIVADADLQSWAKELVSDAGGRLKNFGEDSSGAIKTLDYLIDTVCSVIFIASAQHAAMNFPQNELMTYAPAFPLAVYSPAPTNPDESMDWMEWLPSLEKAENQVKVCYLLGAVYYTQLGGYGKKQFTDSKVKAALGKFQNRLKDIEKEITKKNSSRIMPYKFLLPSQIPQSINI
ncbi:lipoxygenase family protein [Oscillatoria acuminata]|uniref:Lipoxygenase n=1 Tax=Oscillatoria acuminata PCC 6304 TaxID=56110 RepID=K9TJJ9_9CYAN|nr:lipoxygenase family protein [Oscillatoria acuminata]AFY82199.1 Lipoxygenase [Oscillatoria acuminata PCC 6304]